MNKLIVLHGWELLENVACYRHLYLLINIYLLSQPEKWKLVGCSVYLNSVWHISEFLGCVSSDLLYFLFLDMSLFKSYTLKIPYFYLFPSYRGSRIVLWISLFIYLPNYVWLVCSRCIEQTTPCNFLCLLQRQAWHLFPFQFLSILNHDWEWLGALGTQDAFSDHQQSCFWNSSLEICTQTGTRLFYVWTSA